MATSPAHKFGQIIGDAVEAALIPLLEKFARKHGLFLDKHGCRPCRKGQKCSWRDLNGNVHDLDFVLERGGTPDKKGVPAAFIEVAWRRYTKHSRNKAQEIQGAIKPLAETYRNAGPFLGAILAGVFTEGALDQLRSLGFNVLHFSYDSVVSVFREFGVDAAFGEDTPDAEFAKKVKAFRRLSPKKREALAGQLLKAHAETVTRFMAALAQTVLRQVERIVILPLFGTPLEVKTVAEAIRFLQGFDEAAGDKKIQVYEVRVEFNNGNRIEGRFMDRESAIAFLRTYHPAPVEGFETPRAAQRSHK
jgi:hypothetical protein